MTLTPVNSPAMKPTSVMIIASSKDIGLSPFGTIRLGANDTAILCWGLKIAGATNLSATNRDSEFGAYSPPLIYGATLGGN